MQTFADKILAFNKDLTIKTVLPPKVEVMNPYQNAEVFDLCSKFYRKYYADTMPRTMILGINPGRFGGGRTGIPFTDAQKLETICGIKNHLEKRAELSADFIYQMMQAYGGPEKFYGRFIITAVSPLGFMKNGKNLNYYDVPELQHNLKHFIVDSLSRQISFGINPEFCYCLGEGQNFRYLAKLNNEFNFFKDVVPLPHPRFIMQYRRKRVDEFVRLYLQKLG